MTVHRYCLEHNNNINEDQEPGRYIKRLLKFLGQAILNGYNIANYNIRDCYSINAS